MGGALGHSLQLPPTVPTRAIGAMGVPTAVAARGTQRTGDRCTGAQAPAWSQGDTMRERVPGAEPRHHYRRCTFQDPVPPTAPDPVQIPCQVHPRPPSPSHAYARARRSARPRAHERAPCPRASARTLEPERASCPQPRAAPSHPRTTPLAGPHAVTLRSMPSHVTGGYPSARHPTPSQRERTTPAQEHASEPRPDLSTLEPTRAREQTMAAPQRTSDPCATNPHHRREVATPALLRTR